MSYDEFRQQLIIALIRAHYSADACLLIKNAEQIIEEVKKAEMKKAVA